MFHYISLYHKSTWRHTHTCEKHLLFCNINERKKLRNLQFTLQNTFLFICHHCHRRRPAAYVVAYFILRTACATVYYFDYNVQKVSTKRQNRKWCTPSHTIHVSPKHSWLPKCHTVSWYRHKFNLCRHKFNLCLSE